MPIFVITYDPSKANPDPGACAANVGANVAHNAPWIRLSVATWAVETNATPSLILQALAGIVHAEDFYSVSQSAWFQTNHPELSWNPQQDSAQPVAAVNWLPQSTGDRIRE